MAAGSIIVDLLMRTGSFETDTQRASKTAQKAAKDIERQFDAAAKAMVIGFTAVQTALTALVLKTTQSAQEIDRFAKLANTSAESFQYMAAGAAQFGIQQDKLADILKDVQDKVGDFLQTGAGPLADFFEKIAPQVGVTAEQFRRLSGKDALQLYVSSLERANLSQAEMTFYMEAIASDSTLLLPLLRDNAAAMKEFGDRAQRTGQIMSDDLIKNAVEFQNKMRELNGILQGFGNQIVSGLLPSLTQFVDELRIGIDVAGGFGNALRTLGTINPFRSQADNLAKYREELEDLQKARDRYLRARADTSVIDQAIATLQTRIRYLEALQTRAFQATVVPMGTENDARRGRGANIGAGNISFNAPALPAPSTTPTTARSVGPSPAMREAQREAEAYDAWMQQMREGEIQHYLKMLDRQDDALRQSMEEKQKEEEAYQDWMREMQMAEHERYFDMLAQREDATKKTQDLARDLGLTFTSAFEDAIVEGKKLSDVLRGLARDILRIATRKLVTEPLGNALSSAIGGMFGGAKAGGGDVIGGRSYLVGENGPEMFTPRTTGTITPSGATGGTTIVQNINISTGVSQTVRTEIMSMLPRITEAAKAAVVDSRRRGGTFAKAFA